MWRYRLGVAGLFVLTVACAVWVVALVYQGKSPNASEDGGAQVAEVGPTETAEPPTPDAVTSTPPTSPVITAEDSPTAKESVVEIPAGAEEVVISKHTDGDTLHVTAVATGAALVAGVDTTVRLLEIDTPESVAPGSPVECFARKASEGLAKLLPVGAHAWVLPDQELLDPFGRTLLYLWNHDGVFVNLEMVRTGLARAVLFEPNDLYIDVMRAAEAAARSEGKGLWGRCDYFGQPAGLLGSSEKTPVPANQTTDPRFDWCYEANDAGFGNYVRGRDPEYDWYDDADGDGLVCEF